MQKMFTFAANIPHTGLGKLLAMFYGSALFPHLTKKLGSLFATHRVGWMWGGYEKSHKELRDPWFKVNCPYKVPSTSKICF